MFKGLNQHFKLANKMSPFIPTALVVSALIGCGSIEKRQQSETEKAPQQAAVETVTTTTIAPPAPEPISKEIKAEISKLNDLSKKAEEVIGNQESHDSGNTNGSAHAAQANAHHESVKGTDPNVAFKWLKNGNVRFKKGFLRNDGQTKKDVERLSKGQAPHSIVLSCSDSRVPPEIVFDQKLGELFVVRTAGETLDPTSIASIEYAIEHLGSRNLVVLGHTSCGAVKAAFGTRDGKDAGSPNLNALVKDIHPRIAAFPAEPSKDFEKESWANVGGVAEDLAKRSEIIKSALASGKIKIRQAVYHLGSGNVDFKE